MGAGGVYCALRLIVSVTGDKLDSYSNPRALSHIRERSQLPSGGTHKTEGGPLEFLKGSASSIRVTLFIYLHFIFKNLLIKSFSLVKYLLVLKTCNSYLPKTSFLTVVFPQYYIH